MMEIRCCGASADCVAAEVLTSGMTGKQVRFAFDETWGGLSKTAVFVGAVKESVQLEQETVEIPASVLAVAGVPLVIGVRGESEDGALVIPTVYARCGMILPGADTVPTGAEVTPSQAQQLQSQIDELKKAGGGEPSGGAVSSVNGQTGAVVLNAEDVGALPDTTQIPAVPAALPNPYKLTFTGAVSAEYDGSAAVSVEIPSGGGELWNKIYEIETTEAVTSFTVDLQNEYNEVLFLLDFPVDTNNTSNKTLGIALNNGSYVFGQSGYLKYDVARRIGCIIYVDQNINCFQLLADNRTPAWFSQPGSISNLIFSKVNKVRTITIEGEHKSFYFGAGTRLIVCVK